MARTYRARRISKRLAAALGLLLIVVIVAVLELTGVTHLFHKEEKPVASGSSFNTKGEKSASGSKKSSSDSGGQASDKANGSGLALVAPSGDFVSNHHPNLGGSPAPNTMASVCNTTPGASCTISFTKAGITKSLTAQKADANGSVFWNWKLQDVGLSTGSWKVEATASLDGQSKTSSDALELVVAP